MKIKVQDVTEDGMRLSLAGYAAGGLSKNVEVDGPIAGKLLITKQGTDDLHIRGTISARIFLDCGRCLISFGYPVKSEFYVDCTPVIKTGFGQEHRLYGEELNLHFYEGDTLDIDEIIENQLCLETPMVPLCRADCPGLCLHCGEKLNGEPHDCLKQATKSPTQFMNDL